MRSSSLTRWLQHQTPARATQTPGTGSTSASADRQTDAVPGGLVQEEQPPASTRRGPTT